MEVYRYLMIVAAMMVCLGHGSNDVSNSISPLLMVLGATSGEESIKYAYVLGSLGIALGLLVLGYRVMETVGKNVVKLDFAKGFTAQFATAVSVNAGSIIGMPLSTTHCMVGALLGLILAQKTNAVKEVYPDEEEKKDESEDQATITRETTAESNAIETSGDQFQKTKTANDFAKGNVIANIIIWWAATVPVALIASYYITKLAI